MRKFKTLCVILVVSCLALSSLMASPSTWGWLQSSQSSEVLEVPAETSEKEPAKSTKASTGSKTTSKTEYVMVPRSVFEESMADIEEGNAYNKKGGEQVNAAKADLSASAKVIKDSKFQTFGVIEGAYGLDNFELGLGLGFIFKDCLIGKVGIEKKNILDMSDWLDWKNAYKATASIGIIF